MVLGIRMFDHQNVVLDNRDLVLEQTNDSDFGVENYTEALRAVVEVV